MIRKPAAKLLDQADSRGWRSSAEKTRGERSESGQFFTPSPIARCLAGWFDEKGFDRPSLHMLDPGAGGGVLTAAAVDRILALRSEGGLPWLSAVTLETWELDGSFLPALRENLNACAEALEEAGIRATIMMRHGSYIEGAARALDPGLFGTHEAPRVTHAILNPPYRKIATRSPERALLASVGIETTNLYAAFVWLALRQLVEGGELTAITPRSFCNGPYFRDFRRELLASSTFSRLHVFDSRLEAFSRDEVLQENILFHLRRTGTPGKGAVMITTGSLEAPALAKIARESLVSPADPDQIIHVTTETDAAKVRSFFETLPCKLGDLGIEVSTGPVVDFRLKEFLTNHRTSGAVPLIYPHCVKAGQVLAPATRSADYEDGRVSKKPVAIRETDETRKWLLTVSRFVLIKRFSSKEEKRRLVAGVLEPSGFPDGAVGIENHLNFFHRKRGGLSPRFARGLCRFLNSTVADRYFRHFNGHTQVNATDLRSFRYPDEAALEKLGAAPLDDVDQDAIDLAMSEWLGAPSFQS